MTTQRNPLLHNDPDMLNLLEQDLKNKIVDAVRTHNLFGVVDGVFSVDELEQRMETDIATGRMAFGVCYQGLSLTEEAQARGNVDHGQGVGMGQFLFAIIMAVRVDATCLQRVPAQRVLTILRMEINQSTIQSGPRPEAVRTWRLVQEKPETSQSSSEMLYYSQLYRITLPTQTK